MHLVNLSCGDVDFTRADDLSIKIDYNTEIAQIELVLDRWLERLMSLTKKSFVVEKSPATR